MILAIFTAIFTLLASKSFPKISNIILKFSHSIDFSKTLLDVMLGFLLFASALHFDLTKLKENLRGVLIISTVGVVLSTLLFGSMLHFVTGLLNISLPWTYCLLFGALVLPTDAVAVAALLKKTTMPSRLETIISGESLFNDGIGLVLFVAFLELAEHTNKTFSLSVAAELFGQEVFGGLLLGGLLGAVAYRMMRAIGDFKPSCSFP
jgi:CPA1 family monovalent cation:H+ antiporter